MNSARVIIVLLFQYNVDIYCDIIQSPTLFDGKKHKVGQEALQNIRLFNFVADTNVWHDDFYFILFRSNL